MDLRLLRYFIALAEEQHFGRAAERLGISPPTLTVQIQVLEKAVGTKLLIRRGRYTLLNNAGQRFLVECRATLKQAEKAERVAREAARGEIATISIGYVMAAAMSGDLSNGIAKYSKEHPGVSFRLQRLETIMALRALVERNVDVGITRAPVRYPPELTGFSISRYYYWVALPAKHPLTKKRELTKDDLAGIPYIAPALETEIGFRGNLAEISSDALPPVSDAPAADVVSVLTLVAAGLGITLVSEPMTRVNVPNVTFRRLKGTQPGAELVAVYRKSEDSTAVMQFIDKLRSLVQEDARNRFRSI
jgi:DNA-binding transcriptional LysR family regulator